MGLRVRTSQGGRCSTGNEQEAERVGVGTMTRAAWAVLNQKGRVVVIFAGGDALVEAQEWERRGYRLAAVEV